MPKLLMSKRNLLTNLLAAPAIITTPGLLMPVKRVHHHNDLTCYKAINGMLTVPTRDYPIVLQWYNNMGEQEWLRWSARNGLGYRPLTIVRGA